MLSGRAHRRRRGLSLVDAALGMIAGALALTLVLEMLRGESGRLRVQSEARALSDIAEQARHHASHDYHGLIAGLRSAAGNVLILTEGDLRSTGSLEAGRPLTVASGAGINVAAWLPTIATTEGRIILAAWADAVPGSTTRGHAPVIEAGMSLVGRVGMAGGACPASHFCGGGSRWDAAGLISALGPAAPEPGDLVAFRMVHPDADIRPFLHRTAVPGATELNRIIGEWTMRGNDITGFERLAVSRLNVAGDADIRRDAAATGAEIIDRMESGGRIAVGGDLVGLSGENATELTTGSLVLAGGAVLEDGVRTGSLAAAGIRAAHLAVDGTLESPLVNVQGVRPGGMLSAESIAATRLSVGAGQPTASLQVDQIEIHDSSATILVNQQTLLAPGAKGIFHTLRLDPALPEPLPASSPRPW